MHFHARKAIRLHRMAIYSILIGFFILGFSPGVSFAVDGEWQGCRWTDSDGNNYDSCSVSGSDSSTYSSGYSGEGFVALGEVFGAFLQNLFFPPKKPKSAKEIRMTDAIERGNNYFENKEFWWARKEFQIAHDNCTKKKDCKKISVSYYKTYFLEYWIKAYNYHDKGNFVKAIPEYKTAYGYCERANQKSSCKSLYKGYVMAQVDLLNQNGNTWFEIKNWSLARQEYQKALKICKKNKLKCSFIESNLYFHLANSEGVDLLYDDKNYAEALKLFKIAYKKCDTKNNCNIIQRNINNAQSKLNWTQALNYREQGNFSLAKKYYKKALKICVMDCDSLENQYSYVLAVLETDRNGKLGAAIDEAIANGNRRESLRLWNLRHQKCKTKECRSFIENKIDWTQAYLNETLGNQAVRQGDYEQAIRSYEEAAKACPTATCRNAYKEKALEAEIKLREANSRPTQVWTLPTTPPAPDPVRPTIGTDSFYSQSLVSLYYDAVEEFIALEDVPGQCAGNVPGNNCDNEFTATQEIEMILTAAIERDLPEQLKLDLELEDDKISPEEWRQKAAVQERQTLSRIQKLGQLLETTRQSLVVKKVENNEKATSGQMSIKDKNEANQKLSRAQNKIEDLQGKVEEAEEEVVGRINLLPPVYDDEEE